MENNLSISYIKEKLKKINLSQVLFTTRLRTTIVLSLFGFLIYLFILICLPRPSTVMSVSSNTEALTYRATNPTQSSISLGSSLLVPGNLFDENESQCVSGIFTPNTGVIITYRKYIDGFTIEFIETNKIATTIGSLKLPSGEQKNIKSDDLFIVSTKEEECASDSSHVRLPIWGPAELGEEFRALGSDKSEPGLLLEGIIDIYGRSSETLGPFDNTAGLYSSGSIKLPTGSRVVEVKDKWLTGKPWWGIVHASMNETYFTVNATTEAYELALFTPGIQNEPETIQVGTFKRLYKDPGILKAQVLVGILLLIFQTLTTYTGLLNWDKKD